MNSVLLLTKLQLRQTFGGIRGAIEKKTGANGAMAGTALIGIIMFAGIAWFGYSAYGLVGTMGLAKSIYNILFMACGTLTFTFSLPSILGTFFGSSDINDLLPLPVSPFAIVFSKALSALTTAYLWTFVFIAAPLAGWGIAGTMAGGLSFRFWVVYVLAVIFTPMMPVSYAGTISIVIAALFKRVRRKDAITTIATVLTLGISVGAFFIVNQTNSGSGIIQMLGTMGESIGSVVMAFPAYGFAVYALVHPDPLGSWLFVLLSIAAFIVFVVVARVLYMRIVTSLSSGAGRVEAYTGKGSQQQTPVFKALLPAIHNNASIALSDLMAMGMSREDVNEVLPSLLEFEKTHGKYADYNGKYAKQDFGAMAEATRKSYFTLDELCAACPSFPMKATLDKLGKGGSPRYLATREWLETFNGVWTPENLEVIKLIAKMKVLGETRPYRDPSVLNQLLEAGG